MAATKKPHPGPAPTHKHRKYGRNKVKCARYRAEGRREKRKARNRIKYNGAPPTGGVSYSCQPVQTGPQMGQMPSWVTLPHSGQIMYGLQI